MSIRLLGLFVVLAGLCATAPPAGGVAEMGDVAAGRYFTKPVQWMVDEEITTGTSPTCFSPDNPVTRGQAAAFMWRMEGFPAPVSDHPFVDVLRDWQQDPVSWMYENEITVGTSPTTYGPEEQLTRGQMAALVHRLAGEPKGAPPHPFVDVFKEWQQLPVSWMADEGITTGTSPTMFSPEDTVTRGQLAAFFYRYKDEPPVVVDPLTPYCPTGPVPTTTELSLPSGASPGAVAAGSLFVVNRTTDKVHELDEATGGVLRTFDSCAPGEDLTSAIATGFGSVWFAPEVVGVDKMCEVDIASGSMTTHDLPAGSAPSRIATGEGYVWYTVVGPELGDPLAKVARLDPDTGDIDEFTVTDSEAEPGGLKGPIGITTGFDSVWVADAFSGSVRRLDPSDGTEIGFYGALELPFGVAVGQGSVWFTDLNKKVLGEIDPATDKVTLHTGISGNPSEVVVGPPSLGGIWVTELNDATGGPGDTILRYEPALDQFIGYPTPTTDSRPFAITSTGDNMWVQLENVAKLMKIS